MRYPSMVWDEVTQGVNAREGEPWRLTYNKISRMLPFKQPDSQRDKYHGPKRWRYSPETMKALTISALTKLPLNWLSLLSQKL